MQQNDNPRRVLVTAGASGIGAEMARAFLQAGYAVQVCDIDPDTLASFLAAHPDISGMLADVADPDQVEALFDRLLESSGGLDVLVNNAGIAGPTAPVDQVGTADWRRTLAVNLDGPFLCARAATPLLRRSDAGSMINVSSTAGLFGYPNRLPYAVSKWGLVGMTKTLAMELGPVGIRVNALCPGSVAGERIEGVLEREAHRRGLDKETVRREYQRQCSLRRFVAPAEVAAMAVFLASDTAGAISGQVIAVDGHTEGLFSLDDEVSP